MVVAVGVVLGVASEEAEVEVEDEEGVGTMEAEAGRGGGCMEIDTIDEGSEAAVASGGTSGTLRLRFRAGSPQSVTHSADDRLPIALAPLVMPEAGVVDRKDGPTAKGLSTAQRLAAGLARGGGADAETAAAWPELSTDSRRRRGDAGAGVELVGDRVDVGVGERADGSEAGGSGEASARLFFFLNLASQVGVSKLSWPSGNAPTPTE